MREDEAVTLVLEFTFPRRKKSKDWCGWRHVNFLVWRRKRKMWTKKMGLCGANLQRVFLSWRISSIVLWTLSKSQYRGFKCETTTTFSGVRKLKHRCALYPRKLSQYRKLTVFLHLVNDGCMEYISEKSKLSSHLMRSGYLDLFQGRWRCQSSRVKKFKSELLIYFRRFNIFSGP